MTNALTHSQVFGLRVRAARQQLGWTQQQLIDRLAEHEVPMDRSTLVKLERGQGAPPPLDKVFGLAAALDVSPRNLILPLEDEQPVAVTPKRVVPAWLARGWVLDKFALPGRSVTSAELPKSELEELAWRARTRGMSGLTAALAADKLKEEVRRTVDEIRNPKEDDDGHRNP